MDLAIKAHPLVGNEALLGHAEEIYRFLKGEPARTLETTMQRDG